jgi:hypothetical protein
LIRKTVEGVENCMGSKKVKPDHEAALERAFIELPVGIQAWFLDTCVWSEIVSSDQLMKRFVSYFQSNNHLAGLTAYTLFELSRADRILPYLDNLFSIMRHNVWIALLYDQLFESELASYPAKPIIRWMPLSMLTGEDNQAVKIMTKLAKNPLFKMSRDEHLDFGFSSFMSLEKFKKNFPPSNGQEFSSQQAYDFSLWNGIDYFLRHEPQIIKRLGPRNFLPEGIPSQFARSLFLFFKYYIHGQSPNKSDFLDFAHISYVPYFDVYVTEKNVSNVLRHIKSTGLLLADIEIMNVTGFVEMFTSV